MSKADVNFQSYADVSDIHVQDFEISPTPGTDWADSLKLSHVTRCSFTRGIVWGTRENAIDMNRGCEAVRIEDVSLHGGDQASIVVKGGCDMIHFKDVLIIAAPRSWCDVLWDDWSDQSQEVSRGILENIHRDDGKPVRLAFGRFRRPQVIGGNVRVLWPQTFALHAYNIGKGILRKLKLA